MTATLMSYQVLFNAYFLKTNNLMLNTLKKHAPIISILLLIALIVALFFSTPSARLLSIIIIVFGIGTAILFTIHSNWETKQNEELTTAQFTRNSIIDLLGLALVMGRQYG